MLAPPFAVATFTIPEPVAKLNDRPKQDPVSLARVLMPSSASCSVGTIDVSSTDTLALLALQYLSPACERRPN